MRDPFQDKFTASLVVCPPERSFFQGSTPFRNACSLHLLGYCNGVYILVSLHP